MSGIYMNGYRSFGQESSPLRATDHIVAAMPHLAFPSQPSSIVSSTHPTMATLSDTTHSSQHEMQRSQTSGSSCRPPKLWAPGQESWFTAPAAKAPVTSSVASRTSNSQPKALRKPLPTPRREEFIQWQSKWRGRFHPPSYRANTFRMNKALQKIKQCTKFMQTMPMRTISEDMALGGLTACSLIVIGRFLTNGLSTLHAFVIAFLLIRILRLVKNVVVLYIDNIRLKKAQDSKLKPFKLDGRGRSKSNRDSSGCSRCDDYSARTALGACNASGALDAWIVLIVSTASDVLGLEAQGE